MSENLEEGVVLDLSLETCVPWASPSVEHPWPLVSEEIGPPIRAHSLPGLVLPLFGSNLIPLK